MDHRYRYTTEFWVRRLNSTGEAGAAKDEWYAGGYGCNWTWTWITGWRRRVALAFVFPASLVHMHVQYRTYSTCRAVQIQKYVRLRWCIGPRITLWSRRAETASTSKAIISRTIPSPSHFRGTVVWGEGGRAVMNTHTHSHSHGRVNGRSPYAGTLIDTRQHRSCRGKPRCNADFLYKPLQTHIRQHDLNQKWLIKKDMQWLELIWIQ